MSKLTVEEREQHVKRLAEVREQLRETGRTVLNPSEEWSALRSEMLTIERKLK